MSKNNRYNREFRKPEEEVKTESVKVEEEKEEVKEEPIKKPKIKKGYVIAQLLNVRTEPAKGNNVVGQLPNGTPVDIMSVELPDGWSFVKGEVVKGVSVSGYVMSEYIKED